MGGKGEILKLSYKTIGEFPHSPPSRIIFDTRGDIMGGKGEILKLSYKTIGGISPFSTIN